jgi:S-DNA-T family DNA segregation ATPase FtsK/SpoIIIE
MLGETHLLIAGATGSGKSTVLQGIMSTILHCHPTRKRFIMLDRKGTELGKYQRTPHCMRYAMEPDDMIQALREAVQLMNDRYNHMRAHGQTTYEGSDVYIIIDELAELMTTRKKAAIPLLQTLGQVARASRIHMICCTQSPLREIIPTPIKCNFPARIALKTATRQDSRNIIDIGGAELLPDPMTEHTASMYYRHGATTERYDHIPMIPDHEITQLIDHWEAQTEQEAPAPRRSLFQRIFHRH